MATQAVLTYAQGKLEVHEELRERLHLVDGQRLSILVEANGEELASDPVDWRSFRGMLSGHPEHDTTQARAEERAWELEHDRRKSGFGEES